MIFANQLASQLWNIKTHNMPKLAVVFVGDLGAGKTHIIKQIARQWLGDDRAEITSPTFSLIHLYEKNGRKILHGDFYRLTNPSEAEELNLLDYYCEADVLLEWPEKIAGWLPDNYLEVKIEMAAGTMSAKLDEAESAKLDEGESDEARIITLTAHDNKSDNGYGKEDDKDYDNKSNARPNRKIYEGFLQEFAWETPSNL